MENTNKNRLAPHMLHEFFAAELAKVDIPVHKISEVVMYEQAKMKLELEAEEG